MANKRIIMRFTSREMADEFLSWFSTSGEQGYMEVCRDDGIPVDVDYSRAFEAWGYEPANGTRIIDIKEDKSHGE